MRRTQLLFVAACAAIVGFQVSTHAAPAIQFRDGVCEGDRFQFADRLFRWDMDANGNGMMDEIEVSESTDGGSTWVTIDSYGYDNCIDWRRLMRFAQEKRYVYKTVENRDLKLYVHTPPGWQATDSRPAIVWFFGGAWNTGTPMIFRPQADYFSQERGMVAIRVDYRVAQRDGITANGYLSGMDAKSAMRWVRQNAGILGIDTNKVVAGGDSAGGHLALVTWRDDLNDPNDDLSIPARADAFVLSNPYVKIQNGAEGDAASVWPVITNSPPAMWFAYGTADSLAYNGTNPDSGSNYIDECVAEGVDVTTYIVEGAGHGFCASGAYLAPATEQMDNFLVAKGFLSGSAGTLPTKTASAMMSELRAEVAAGNVTLSEANYGESINNASLVESVTDPETVASDLTVRFAYDMNSGSLASGIVVSNQTASSVVAGSWSNSATRTYTFVPSTGYVEDNEYAVTFNTSLADASANSQAIARTAHFRPSATNDTQNSHADIWVRQGITDDLPGGTVVYDTTSNWSSQTVADTNNVIIENGATVTLDQADIASLLRVNESGTFAVGQDVAITLSAALQVGFQGAGTVNQSTGTVTTASLAVNSAVTTNLSQYNLSGGTVSVTSALAVNEGGELNQSGGSLSVSGTADVNRGGELNLSGGVLTASTAPTVNSGGELNVSGGRLAISGNNALSVASGGLVDISGGSVWRDLNEGHMSVGVAGGTIRVRDGGALLLTNTVEYVATKTLVFGGGSTLEIGANGILNVHSQFSIRDGSALTVSDRGADIRIGWLGTGGVGGDLAFELDEAGVSTVNVVGGWCSLGDIELTVDGSAYTGGSTTSVLVDAVNLHNTSTVVNVTGFNSGYTATVVQDQDVDEVQLIIEASSEYVSELATVAALGNLTNAPTIRADDMTMATTNVSPGEMKAIYFDALDYTGSVTRAYAWLGIPDGASAGSPVPGVVLVHGGGGTAFKDWVTEWTNRGYAAISVAVEGQTDWKNDPPSIGTGWHQHAMAGPSRTGIYADTDVEPITDQWMYHAVADTVLANSLLRSLPEVDASKVGLMGISWGGVITSTAIGIDNRFAFAVPTYGCGHKYDARNPYGTSLGDDELYKQVWDPMVRITNATMPAMWYSWPDEWHFPLDCQAYTYHGAPGARMVAIVPGWGHGHDWNRPESYDFADSVINDGTPWCVQQSVGVAGGVASAVFTSSKPLTEASLLYGVSNEVATIDLGWVETGVTSLVEAPPDTWTVTANLPASASGWFIKVEATGSDTNDLYGYSDTNLVACSDYREVIKVSTNAVAFTHPSGAMLSTGAVNVVFSVPSNIEITDIQLGNESHAGAFSNLTSAPLAWTASPGILDVAFDNSVAGLSAGKTATCTMTVTWEHLDGSSDQAELPVSATVAAVPTSVDLDDVLSSRIYDGDQDGNGDAVHQHQQWVGELYEDDYATVFVFQMTDDAQPGTILSADFSVTQDASFGDALPNIRVDAYTRSTSPINASDYEMTAGVGSIQANFASATTPAAVSLDAGGRLNLKDFLNANWSPDDYLFIRLKFEGTVTEDGKRFGSSAGGWATNSTDAQLTVEWDTDITELDIDYSDLQRIQEQNADGLGDWVGGSPNNNLVGYFEQSNVGNMHMVWSFQMQGFHDANRIAYADLILEQSGTGGGAYAYDIEVHAIRTASSSTIVASDYEDSAALLMTDFNKASTGTASLDGPGKVALAAYLRDNWSKGDYVVIGLKTDPLTLASYPGGSHDFYRYATGGTLRLGIHPPPGTWFCVR